MLDKFELILGRWLVINEYLDSTDLLAWADVQPCPDKSESTVVVYSLWDKDEEGNSCKSFMLKTGSIPGNPTEFLNRLFSLRRESW